MEENEINKRFKKIESDIIRQENSSLKILKNLYKYGFDSNSKDKAIASWSSVISYILRRQSITIIIAVFSGIIALISCLIAYNANLLIKDQNELVEQQNYKITQQIYLQEAERRSGLVFLFSNVFDKIDSELKEDYLQNKRRDLSPQTIGRITSLSQRLSPYRFFENGEISAKEYSPERGQLFSAILNSKLDSVSFSAITYKSNLENMLLENTNIYKIDLDNINLRGSKFERVYFDSINMNNVNLDKASFKGCKYRNSNIWNSLICADQFDMRYESKLRMSSNHIDSTRMKLDEGYTFRTENSFNSSNNVFTNSNIQIDGDDVKFEEDIFYNSTMSGYGKKIILHNVALIFDKDYEVREINGQLYGDLPIELRYDSIMIKNITCRCKDTSIIRRQLNVANYYSLKVGEGVNSYYVDNDEIEICAIIQDVNLSVIDFVNLGQHVTDVSATFMNVLKSKYNPIELAVAFKYGSSTSLPDSIENELYTLYEPESTLEELISLEDPDEELIYMTLIQYVMQEFAFIINDEIFDVTKFSNVDKVVDYYNDNYLIRDLVVNEDIETLIMGSTLTEDNELTQSEIQLIKNIFK